MRRRDTVPTAPGDPSGHSSPYRRGRWQAALDELTLRASALVPGRGASSLRDLVQEMIELGASGVAFRLRWELGMRSGWTAWHERAPGPPPGAEEIGRALLNRLPFPAASAVRGALEGRIGADALSSLGRRARQATRGRIRCFGRWEADYGDPIDWHVNPVTGQRWDSTRHWSEALKDTGRAGDIKLTWEVGRFPHAYELARAAALGVYPARDAAEALSRQVREFVAANPYGRGVHWSSGQEIVIRLAAWSFAASALRGEPVMDAVMPLVARHLHEGAVHLERYFDYARKASNDNHLISEAFGLFAAGALLPDGARARRWVSLGLETLEREAARQVYPDGGYLMHSHTYQRAALHMYLLATAICRHGGIPVPASWTDAMSRSVDFLLAHQNPADGRLPNFGSNDGASMVILSTCDYSDFRPLLQTLSLATRGERLYPSGPWDEEAAWLLGPAALGAPLRRTEHRSASFARSGFHVARGDDPGTLTAFRCGTLRDRFTQIDMLHLDVFWRGENVLVDPGTYLYSGPVAWSRHFVGGASHNTVTLDGRDQMVHHRRFKVLYLTPARLLRFEEGPRSVIVEGEHDGFRRHPGSCVHRRSVLFAKDDLWVVVDRIEGTGRHAARLHWLGGPYPYTYDAGASRLALETPAGRFTVTVLDAGARPLDGDVASGREEPPRGWSSRYYAEKVPAPSLAVVQDAPAPIEFVSVLAAGVPQIAVDGTGWRVRGRAREVRFRVANGRFLEVEVGDVEEEEGVPT